MIAPNDVMTDPVQTPRPSADPDPLAVLDSTSLQAKLTDLLAGRYEVIGLIALGGMSSIFQVRHLRHGGLFVAKVLHPSFAARPEVVAAFEHEATTLARLAGHPGIIPLCDCLAADDLHAMILSYVEGEDLDQLLKRRGKLSRDEALTLLSQIAGILLHCEQAGVVHGDISPGNIRLDRFGQYKLLDFGIARQVESAQGTPLSAAGTPAYNSPEQLLHQPLDIRTDLYSLGMVFAECLLGRPLLEAPTLAELAEKHLNGEWSLCAEIDADILLCNLIHRLLQVDREVRVSSPGELLTALIGAGFDHPFAFPPPPGAPLHPPRPRRKRLESA